MLPIPHPCTLTRIAARRLAALAVGLSLLGGARPSPAQTPEPSAAIKRQAVTLFEAGRALYRSEKFEQAAEKFQEAFRLWPQRNLMLNIAICHAELDQPVQSVVYLRGALKLTGEAPERVLDRREYAKLLEMQSKVGVLIVTSDPPDAPVLVNGKEEGRTPFEAVMTPGVYRVTVKRRWGQPALTREVTITGGAEERWAVGSAGVIGKVPTPAGSRRPLGRLAPVWALSVASVAVVGALALIGTGARTEALQESYRTSGDLDDRADGLRYRDATNALVGITVGAAVAASVLAVFTDWKRLRRRERAAADLRPTLGPSGLGLGLAGGF